jgi:hypothetical protein
LIFFSNSSLALRRASSAAFRAVKSVTKGGDIRIVPGKIDDGRTQENGNPATVLGDVGFFVDVTVSSIPKLLDGMSIGF